MPAAPTVLSLNSHGDSAELAVSDLWVGTMTETKHRRQRLEHWLIPTLLGGAAAAGAVTALLPGLSTPARATVWASAGIAAASMFPPIFSKPENRAKWFAIGGGLFAMAYGAAGFVDTLYKRNKDCHGYCFNESSVGWLGAGFFAQGLTLIPLAFVDRGPSIKELEDYKKLPASERPAAARKLIARIDRAERKATIVRLTIDMIGVAVFGAGAALVDDRTDRAILLGFAGFTLGTGTLNNIANLFGKTRLERLVLGEAPDKVERVLW